MTDGKRPRWPRITFALAVPIVLALLLVRWKPTEETTVAHGDRSPAAGATDSRSRAHATPPVEEAPSRATATGVAETAPTGSARPGPPTPGIFDFASMTPRPPVTKAGDDDRFVTNERFTQDDLNHPERYFEAAAHAPALNKPEARRDTLEFFRAYRAKLERDLDVQANATRRTEVLAIMDRYDDAIERLEGLIAGE